MYEPDNVVQGRDAISAVAGALLDRFGPTFRFTPAGMAVGHHGLGSLQWQAGDEGGPSQSRGRMSQKSSTAGSRASGFCLTRRKPETAGAEVYSKLADRSIIRLGPNSANHPLSASPLSRRKQTVAKPPI